MRKTVLALLTATMLAVTVAGSTALAVIESGTNRADDLVGTGDHDNLKGWGGDDTIKGRGALDRLYGMNEADTVHGGGGPDYVYGGDGRDVILGGPGGDHLRGGKSDNGDADDPYGSGEEIHGGAGDDTIFGSGDLFGDGGNDSLRAAQGKPDTVSCGAGRDRVYADPALDTVADDCEDARPAR